MSNQNLRLLFNLSFINAQDKKQYSCAGMREGLRFDILNRGCNCLTFAFAIVQVCFKRTNLSTRLKFL